MHPPFAASPVDKHPVRRHIGLVSSLPPLTTALYPRTQKRVNDAQQRLFNLLQPWWALSCGGRVAVRDFYGRTISYQGILFSGSPRIVFWTVYVGPFVEDEIVRVLDETGKECVASSLEPASYLAEAAAVLQPFVRGVVAEMMRMDRTLMSAAKHDTPIPIDVDAAVAEFDRFIGQQLIAATHIYRKPVPPAKAPSEDLIDLKPNFCGIGLNLNALWRRVRHWFGRKPGPPAPPQRVR